MRSIADADIETVRAALADTLPPASLGERRMFGGLCFLLNGNMLCGLHKGGAMFRVGKEREAEALGVPGARPLGFTGRKMGGMVETDADLVSDPARLSRLIGLCVGFVGALPPK